jgi:hypothetical protein
MIPSSFQPPNRPDATISAPVIGSTFKALSISSGVQPDSMGILVVIFASPYAALTCSAPSAVR